MTTSLAFILIALLAGLTGYGWCRWRVVRLTMQRTREHRAEDARQATWTAYADAAEAQLSASGERIAVLLETVEDLRSGRSLARTEAQRDALFAQVDAMALELDALDAALKAETTERERIERIAVGLDANYEDILARYREVPVAFRATPAQLLELTDAPAPLPRSDAHVPALEGGTGAYAHVPIVDAAHPAPCGYPDLIPCICGPSTREVVTRTRQAGKTAEALTVALSSAKAAIDGFATAWDESQSKEIATQRAAIAASPRKTTYPAKAQPGRRTRRKQKAGSAR